MARKQSKPQPAEIPEEEMSQDVPDEEPAAVIEPEPAGSPQISKADAIRRALAEGLTKAEDALPFIKTHFGHDVTPGHFAASKSREKGSAPAEEAPVAPRRGRPPGKANAVKVTVKRGRKPKAESSPAAESTPQAPRPAAPARNGEADLIGAMEAIKPLVASLGADKVKRLVDLLG